MTMEEYINFVKETCTKLCNTEECTEICFASYGLANEIIEVTP